MCGLAGILSVNNWTREQLLGSLTHMCDAIAHRGPDDQGVWVDVLKNVALGHRRLSIVDLSEQGRQPMVSHCGRYVMVFNGEIYNNLELRQMLGNRPWRGHSDTETILALVSDFGPIRMLDKLVGMFTIAVWDRELGNLTLARDRMGEKPLYYGRLESGDFVFGSELHALRAHPCSQPSIDRNALALYMRYSVVPGEYSIYKGIYKLLPGSWMQVNLQGEVTRGTYWDLRERAFSSVRERTALNDSQALDELERLMGEAVSGQMVADVPLGAFLSGGVDSSAIVAMMRRQSGGKIRTFSIGFDEPGYNEAVHAKAIAKQLGTLHTELYVTGDDALAVVPKLTQIYDEPFADSSQIPTYLVAHLARQHVAVALSGDGGDELFAGYNRYLLATRAWQGVSRVPWALRKFLSAMLLSMAPHTIDVLSVPLQKLLRNAVRQGNVGDKLHKFARTVLLAHSSHEMYRSLVSQWEDPAAVVIGSDEPKSLIDEFNFAADFTAVDRMCLLDQLTYLPDDILVKVDRAAMSLGLETRVPMLDHRIVEFAWSLPMNQKFRDGKGKWLLRQLLYKYVPREMIERPKQGFAIPLEHWLRGPLKPWAEDLLSREALQVGGFFEAAQIRAKWTQHLSGQRNWQHQIWNVLIFQSWYFNIHCPGLLKAPRRTA